MEQALTVTNILVSELNYALGRILPPEAYDEIKGTRKKNMTDTKSQWIFLKLDEIFGPAGYGWWAELAQPLESLFDSGSVETPASKVTTSVASWGENADGKFTWLPDTKTVVETPATKVGKDNNNPWTSTVVVKFYYRYRVGDQMFTSQPVIGTGGVNMDRKDFSERGAYTNALGDALKMLGWQRGLWFGKWDHTNAAQKYAAQQKTIQEWRAEGKHVPGDPIETE